jgi:hypothetical protein
MTDPAAGYPATLTISDPAPMKNWRPLVQWFLALPHLVVAHALATVSGAVWLASLVMLVVTGSLPKGLFDLQVMSLRYQNRAWGYALFLHDRYPTFDYTVVGIDPGNDAIAVSVERPEVVNRWLGLVKWFLAIPHYLVIVVLVIAAYVVWIVAFFAVLFTGSWPVGLRRFVVRVAAYVLRVEAYVLLLRDEYPPFSLG